MGGCRHRPGEPRPRSGGGRGRGHSLGSGGRGMRDYASPPLAMMTIGLAMAAGVYLIAVLDRSMATLVGGGRCTMRDSVIGPLRSAALLLVQRRRATERPDA